MLYMVIEHYLNGNPVPVYSRFREKGRLALEGLRFVASWVSEDLTTCYQIMDTEDRKSLDKWIAEWEDLVDFEVVPVITSAEASMKVSVTS